MLDIHIKVNDDGKRFAVWTAVKHSGLTYLYPVAIGAVLTELAKYIAENSKTLATDRFLRTAASKGVEEALKQCEKRGVSIFKFKDMGNVQYISNMDGLLRLIAEEGNQAEEVEHENDMD